MQHICAGFMCHTRVGFVQHANNKLIPLSQNESITTMWSHRKHAGEVEKAYQMPLASGQSLAIKAHVNNGDTGLSNKKWSYRRER